VARKLARSLGLFVAVLLCALVGGALLPRNGGSMARDASVPVFVRSNGVHTDIVMPARAAGLDCHRLVPPGHVQSPSGAGEWVAIGTGERETFLNTPRWRDIRVRTLGRFVFGGELLLHVEHVDAPRPGPRVRALRLRPEQALRLGQAIAGTFRRGVDGHTLPLAGTGFGARDVFYLASGRYDALRNCNQWTADMLGKAGVRVGRWTPLAPAVLASLN